MARAQVLEAAVGGVVGLLAGTEAGLLGSGVKAGGDEDAVGEAGAGEVLESDGDAGVGVSERAEDEGAVLALGGEACVLDGEAV